MFKPRSAQGAARRSRKTRNPHIRKLLAQPIILEEAGPPRVLTQLVRIASVLFIGLLVWAGIAEIRETALAEGQVVPAGAVYAVQHLEGGIVAEILVEDGDIVEAGEPLIRLRAAGTAAELEQLRAREASLALRAERLRAFVMERKPDFTAVVGHAELAADQSAILTVQKEARDSQRRVLHARIQKQKAELAALGKQRAALARQVAILEEQLAMRQELLDKGLVSRVVFLETERTLNRTRGELAAVAGRIASTDAGVREARDSLDELDAGLRNNAVKEMGEVTGELAQVREAMVKQEDRVQRLEVTSPARGIVKGLVAKTVGGVIRPGETVMEIVPFDESLVAEVRISPRDIGHLRVGQEAQVRVSAYDVARFGAVPGHLLQVSATTFEDEQGDPYYKGVVALESDHVGKQPSRNLILPGMVVNVAISTGSKSLLQYLLKPLYRGLDGAFHER